MATGLWFSSAKNTPVLNQRTKTKGLHGQNRTGSAVADTILLLDHRCWIVYWLQSCYSFIYSFVLDYNRQKTLIPKKIIPVFLSGVSANATSAAGATPRATTAATPRALAAGSLPAELSPNCTLNPKPNTPVFRVKHF